MKCHNSQLRTIGPNDYHTHFHPETENLYLF
jgi:hypothetical protein